MGSETLIVDKNAEAFARAFSPYIVGGCTPADVRACAPRIVIEVNPKLSQPERLKMFLDVRGAGIEIDPDQLREETGIRPAANPTLATEEPSTQDLACHRRAACSDARTFSYENKPSREES